MDTKHPLIAQAIQEIGKGERFGVAVLEDSFARARNAHATRKPQPAKSAVTNDPRLAKHPDLAKMFGEQDAHRRKVLDSGFAELHRANLAEFFKIAGATKDTALKIVDEFILKPQ